MHINELAAEHSLLSDTFFLPRLTKLWEGNVFSYVCHSLCGGSHVTITIDTLNFTIKGSITQPQPCQPWDLTVQGFRPGPWTWDFTVHGPSTLGPQTWNLTVQGPPLQALTRLVLTYGGY